MRRLAAAIAVLVLAACGGGGGGGSGGSSGPKPTAAEASRFLTQATFGPTPAGIDRVSNSSYETWINQQIAGAPHNQTHLAYIDARLAEFRRADPNASISDNQFYESWWLQAVVGGDELRQRMKFALSQIFVISLNDDSIDTRGAASYYDMLGRNAFGNFRTLLEDVTLHPMMGRYLTYLANQKESGTRSPDENYAREIMQLMTIGLYELNADGTVRLNAQNQPIPTYTSADISGLARVFTGLSWYNPTPTATTFFGGGRDESREVRPMIFYPQYHSTSAKTFLGVTIPASSTVDVAGDLRIALDTLFNHPNVGPFIAQRLIQQFVTSNPSPAYVGRVAAVFNNNGQGVRGDLGAVVKAILLDQEARSASTADGAGYGKLREPLIRMTNWMRAFGVSSQTGNWLVPLTAGNQSLGQAPLSSPSVFNFWRPGYVPPATTEMGQRSLLAPEFQIVDEVTVASYINTMSSAVDQGFGNTPPGGSGRDMRTSYSAEVALAETPTALIDRVDLLLTSGRMSQTLRQRILDAVNAIAIPGGSATQAQIDNARLNRVKTAVLFTMASPEYLVQR
ncbi:MAG: DUF1800 domain-containing protein [Hyphomonadaceae bacterium]|nr:DUF1800 domain-containing protein [Hyphomonadaceae bacterium]